MAKKTKLTRETNEREKQDRAFITDIADRAIILRNADREFHGLEREFMQLQRKMISDYESSKNIKHPRDVGDRREEILKKFLTDNGLIPAQYGISSRSVRVASPSGHLSKELDIVIFDAMNTISLMRRGDAYEVIPVENVYGTIQVKSRLNKAEIKDGLENIASLKRLTRDVLPSVRFISKGTPMSARPFGILFAYDSDLEWLEIIEEINKFTSSHRDVLCNAIFILNAGFMCHGEDNKYCITNGDIEKIKNPSVYGVPDRQDMNLYHLYDIIMTLSRDTVVSSPEVGKYFRLPLVAGDYSYSYHSGYFAEIALCDKHGDYQRAFLQDKLKTVIEWCEHAEPINWVKANNIAYGLPEDQNAYLRQPWTIIIYNPDGLQLQDILLGQPVAFGDKMVRPLEYDIIECNNRYLAIPYYYENKEKMLADCPRCIAAERRADRVKEKKSTPLET